MVNNDFIYKTMKEMKPFPRLAYLRCCCHAGCRLSDRRFVATTPLGSSLLRSSLP